MKHFDACRMTLVNRPFLVVGRDSRPFSSQLSRHAGLTLVECLVAMSVLAIAVLGLSYVATAGHQHLKQGEEASRAIRLAEHLMEEIASRPYDGSDVGRANWHLQDFDGFEEDANDVRDFSGTLYGPSDQPFFRRVTLTDTSVTVTELGNLTLSGKQVTVVVGLSEDRQWQLTRFFPEPVSP